MIHIHEIPQEVSKTYLLSIFLMKYVLFIFIFVSVSTYCDATEMKIYCFGDDKNISAPFPNKPQYLSGPMKESYMYLMLGDVRENNSQFYYDSYKYNNRNLNKKYLNQLSKGRAEALGAKKYLSKYTVLSNGAQLIYGYRYKNNNLNVKSMNIAIIDGDEYYSWAVQSYEGVSTYDAEYVFNSYRKYVGKNTGYCK